MEPTTFFRRQQALQNDLQSFQDDSSSSSLSSKPSHKNDTLPHDDNKDEYNNQSATNATGFLVIFWVISVVLACVACARLEKKSRERRLEHETRMRESKDVQQKRRLEIKAQLQSKLHCDNITTTQQKSSPAKTRHSGVAEAHNAVTEEKPRQTGTKQDETCPICLATFQPHDLVTVSANLHCPHHFHYDCISTWLLKTCECPCCRRSYLQKGGSDKQSDTESVNDANTVVIMEEEDDEET